MKYLVDPENVLEDDGYCYKVKCRPLENTCPDKQQPCPGKGCPNLCYDPSMYGQD